MYSGISCRAKPTAKKKKKKEYKTEAKQLVKKKKRRAYTHKNILVNMHICKKKKMNERGEGKKK